MSRKLPDYITEGEDGALSVDLLRGIEIAGAKVKSLTLREPTLNDQLAAQKGNASEAELEVALIANLAEVTPEELRRAKMRDYGRLQEALGFFYG
ncbi:phage tail assembly protein [Limimaricola sp. AA108-03]|uniref:phage tail assembly protein n=1 Tax=Limimaricola sp. AA108-03 TaxID=3425945 RepID=UPI003D77BBF5